ncbi:MAG: hypothetical protein ACOC8N_07990 [Spirochaetota bacterium]
MDSPMAVSATAIFQVHQDCYDEETRRAFTRHKRNPFGFEELTCVRSTGDSKRLNTLKGPAVVISSSGMCESGRRSRCWTCSARTPITGISWPARAALTAPT